MDALTAARAAKTASRALASAGTGKKNDALRAIAAALEGRSGEILSANAADIEAAKRSGMREAMLDRLALSPERIAGVCEGVLQVAALDDPIGEALSMKKRPNGLVISQVRVPMGVIGIIYEARPNVTADCAALCLKAGSACVLRGGKEALKTNSALALIMREAVAGAGLPADCICFVDDTRRESANEMMRAKGLIDLLIPRGGRGLIRAVVENATVPVIETGTGNCHVYVDKSADIKTAADILFNAKTQRISVCNAAESLVVHKDIAREFLPAAAARLSEKNVEIRGDEATRAILPAAVPASEEDYFTEYLDYIISCRVVGSLDEAIEHINLTGTGHSECIVTADYAAARRFADEIDAAAVYVNASTRFTDGFEFGLGAEIGISTQKLHARGPMGLRELCTTKYVVLGDGQVRS